ncbi:MAG: hypothetical protein PVH00_05450 [Gemmatimonadota bacterium]|jgi:hypothetical protein
MRSALLAAPLLAAPLLLAARPRPEPPACGDAALAAAPDSWDETSAVTGDLTADGNDDVVFWRREAGAVMLYVAACEGERAVETWRFRVSLADDCATAGMPIEIGSPLLDASLVNRVCASGESDECQHMRRENERRQALADAGARDLRIGGSCAGVRFRWAADLHGFLRIGG